MVEIRANHSARNLDGKSSIAGGRFENTLLRKVGLHPVSREIEHEADDLRAGENSPSLFRVALLMQGMDVNAVATGGSFMPRHALAGGKIRSLEEGELRRKHAE
jgi:hypothetical protein